MAPRAKPQGLSWGRKDGAPVLYRDGKMVFRMSHYGESGRVEVRLPWNNRLHLSVRGGRTTAQGRAASEVQNKLLACRAEIDRILALLDAGTPLPKPSEEPDKPVPATRYDLIG